MRQTPPIQNYVMVNEIKSHFEVQSKHGEIRGGGDPDHTPTWTMMGVTVSVLLLWSRTVVAAVERPVTHTGPLLGSRAASFGAVAPVAPGEPYTVHCGERGGWADIL